MIAKFNFNNNLKYFEANYKTQESISDHEYLIIFKDLSVTNETDKVKVFFCLEVSKKIFEEVLVFSNQISSFKPLNNDFVLIDLADSSRQYLGPNDLKNNEYYDRIKKIFYMPYFSGKFNIKNGSFDAGFLFLISNIFISNKDHYIVFGHCKSKFLIDKKNYDFLLKHFYSYKTFFKNQLILFFYFLKETIKIF